MVAKTFIGGVHPHDYKEYSQDQALERMPLPKRIILPFLQHVGKPAQARVGKGDAVATGMVVAEADGFVSSPIHSSVCGTVASIGRHPHTCGTSVEAMIITCGEDQSQRELLPELDLQRVTPDEIRERVRQAGVVGQGGAAFPTAVKLSPPRGKHMDVAILNGCECEPYLTRDYRLMIERPEAVVSGLKLVMKALAVESGFIGIEDNKTEAIRVLREVAAEDPDISVVAVRTKYPQGAEKMLIKVITGREVPPGKFPPDIGVGMQNVATGVSIHDAVVKGEPLVTAPLTVTGRGIRSPKNLIVPVGTPLEDVLAYCGGLTEDAAKVIVGGPMMGVAQYDLSAPVMKATSGIVVLTREEIERGDETPCLGCGKCVEVCPVHLMPTRLVRYAQLGRFDDAERLGITVCMECGSCSFICPANIPLVQWLRLGKQKALKLQQERKAQ